MRPLRHHRALAVPVVVATIGLVLVACSSSDEAAPTRTVVPAPVGSSGGLDAASDVDPGCLSAAGCFTCEPVNLPDFLNACSEGQCAPFDNVARLPLFEQGKPLPPVP